MAYRKKEEHGTKFKKSSPGKTEINGEACLPDDPCEAGATNGGADSTLTMLTFRLLMSTIFDVPHR